MVDLESNLSHLLAAGAHLKTFACVWVSMHCCQKRAKDYSLCQQLIREKVILHNREFVLCVCDIMQ